MSHSKTFAKLCEHARRQINEIDMTQVKTLLLDDKEFLLIDIREDHEWNQGHLPQAQHLGRGILERDIEKICSELDKKIVLYCGGGYRSALAALSLQDMGYSCVFSMATGYRGWKTADLAIEMPIT